MTPAAVSRRYARALFELAGETGAVDATGEGLAELAAAVESLEPGALASDLFTESQREELGTALAAKVGKDSILGRFLALLARNNRLDQLPGVHACFERMQDEAAGRVRILVRSATPLTVEARAALNSRFEAVTGKKVIDSLEIDDSLLGGVTVEAQGRVFDGSIRTQLARLERRMAG